WKKWFAILILTLVLMGAVAAVFFEVYRSVASRGLKTGSVTAQQLTLRDGPSMSSNDIGRLPYGTRVRILESGPDGQWLHVEVVQLGGSVPDEQPDAGWVGARFVAIDATP
ncbi:MAG: SH3 domain-containing protein, partial [Acidobacteria bacterium]|nr:SH3 domain-containing protein [Acidobacteriota bacterium]